VDIKIVPITDDLDLIAYRHICTQMPYNSEYFFFLKEILFWCYKPLTAENLSLKLISRLGTGAVPKLGQGSNDQVLQVGTCF
jgi:hypothetical protein